MNGFYNNKTALNSHWKLQCMQPQLGIFILQGTRQDRKRNGHSLKPGNSKERLHPAHLSATSTVAHVDLIFCYPALTTSNLGTHWMNNTIPITFY